MRRQILPGFAVEMESDRDRLPRSLVDYANPDWTIASGNRFKP
jgi:hypothetical protein